MAKRLQVENLDPRCNGGAKKKKAKEFDSGCIIGSEKRRGGTD